MDEDIFAQQSYGKVALRKFGKVDENFRLYCCGLVGDYETTDTMKVEGAVFRVAKTGPRKGQLVIEVPGTKRTAYVTTAEMREQERLDADQSA